MNEQRPGDLVIVWVYAILIALLIAVASWTAHQWVSHPGHGRITSDAISKGATP